MIPESPIHIGDKEFEFENLSPEAQILVRHMISIDGKLNQLKFEMDQLQFSRKAVYTQLLAAVTSTAGADQNDAQIVQ